MDLEQSLFGMPGTGWSPAFKLLGVDLPMPEPLALPPLHERYPHYHKRCGFESVDVYRVLKMFEVTDPCIQHAVKKLLVAGQRGAKDFDKDISEAIATLQRCLDMRIEERAAADIA